MSTVTRNDYLETEVMTATPQRLQLMLVEAAIRHTQLCKQCWQNGQEEEATEAVIRAQQIVTEVVCSLRVDERDEVVRKMAGVYLFVFRTLARAQLERDQRLLDEAISVLEVERETWREVCDKFGVRRSTGDLSACDADEPSTGANFEA